MKPTRLGIWGHRNQGINDGFGYAGYMMCKTLNSLGYETYWNDETASIALSFTQPYGYGGLESQYRIGYTPWESTVLPAGWADDMNTRDEMWTPSSFFVDVFRENGVKVPINVVHHGIDTSKWTLSKRQKDDYFIFFHMGEPAERKNGQMVFDAYKKCFGKNPNVYLYYKAHSWVEARWIEDGVVVGPVDSFPRVTANKNSLPQDALNRIYNSVHCMVYPSNGEGFGLIPFQGIATGLPSIFPAWGGLRDFQNYGIEVQYKQGPSHHDYHIGEWCLPDFDDLCDKMIDVYENYETYADKAFESGKSLREKFSWEAVIKEAIELLPDM